MTQRAIFILATLALLECSLGLGCDSPKPTFNVHDPDPSIKIPAIKMAVEGKDLANLRQMVSDLDSDDSAVRFYAIEGLRRLTGETFGFQYYDDSLERAPAIAKWNKWLAERDPKTSAELAATRESPATTESTQ